MRILVIGNGGREHALLRKLRADAPGSELYITRGNGGTAELATHLPIDPADGPALATWSEQNGILLAVCGPEGPLSEGISDHFTRHGVAFFGPTRAAARIETSKAYAKALLTRAGVATAAYGTFSDVTSARAFINERGAPIVVKASGLAAGKGAVVCETIEEAEDCARSMLAGEAFGAAGREIVIEEFMTGEELSVFALCDGEHAVPLLGAQDHKRLLDGDRGPNTGGMGAYAPVSLATPALIDHVRRDILEPTLAALRDDGAPFRGLLYAGLMLTESGPKVIEYNARFGDPETQVVVPMMSSSLLDPLLAIARGDSIAGLEPKWKQGAAVTTVLAAGGYPGTVSKGSAITLPVHDDDVVVFHAGTTRVDGRLVTAGGRVLAVTGFGADMAAAAARSRAVAEAIEFEGKQFRRDIGWRELARRSVADA
jgi:phosphoribosylamine---glycine ligase